MNIDQFVARLSSDAGTTRRSSRKESQELAQIVANLVKNRLSKDVSTNVVKLGQRSFDIVEGGGFRAILLFKFMRTIESAKKNWKSRVGEFYKELGEACEEWKDALPLAVWAVPEEWLTPDLITSLSSTIEAQKKQGRDIALALLPFPARTAGAVPQPDNLTTPTSKSHSSPAVGRQLAFLPMSPELESQAPQQTKSTDQEPRLVDSIFPDRQADSVIRPQPVIPYTL